MSQFQVDDLIIRGLNRDLRDYDGITKEMVRVQNRTSSVNPEKSLKHDDTFQLLEKYKGRKARDIEKALKYWPIWTEWLANVPGAGPYIAGNLIMLYYYKFVPICKKCGSDIVRESEEEDSFECPKCGKVKGDGLLQHRIQEVDFPKISNWWSYCGRAPVDGKIPKRKKGNKSNWSSRGRQVSWQFSEQVNRHKATEPYKAFMVKEKAILEEKRPEIKKGHRHNMAANKVAKLFLSHFWQVARVIAGKPVTEPYSMAHLGHVGMIDPFYWDIDQEIAA